MTTEKCDQDEMLVMRNVFENIIKTPCDAVTRKQITRAQLWKYEYKTTIKEEKRREIEIGP